MKIKIYYPIGLIILVLSGLFISCENVLDVPPSKEMEGTFFETENRVQRSVGAIYAKLADIYGPQLPGDIGTPATIAILTADDITFDGTGSSYETFSGLNAGDARISRLWDRLYQIVARANFVLNKIETPEVQAVYVTKGLKDNNRGEALFLRSWAFYKLWDLFRKAPIQDQRIQSLDDTELMPSEGFQMLDNAIASLEEAAALLPDEWDNQNLGRVTKNSAYGLLVKCNVLRAGYNNKSTEDYNKAIVAYENIKGAELVNFGENFDYRTENNPESLFEYQASASPSEDNAWLDNDFGGAVGQMGAFYHMWDSHWGNYATGIYGPTQKLIDAFEQGDPRMDETLSDNPDNLDGALWWVTPDWDKFNSYQMVKYTNAERGNAFDKDWQLSSLNNPRLIRLADVKLCVAEAYLQTGSPGEALTQVNDIRTRARNSVSPVSSVPANLSSVNMNNIMDERFRELAGEDGHRWTDIRRWDAAGFIDLSSWTPADFGFPSKYDPALFDFEYPKHLLLPIPSDEMNKNPHMAISGNNPGY